MKTYLQPVDRTPCGEGEVESDSWFLVKDKNQADNYWESKLLAPSSFPFFPPPPPPPFPLSLSHTIDCIPSFYTDSQ